MGETAVPIKILKQALVITAVAALFWAVVFTVDLLRIKTESDPILSIPLRGISVDSSSSEYLSYSVTEYWGIGYKVMKYDFGSNKYIFKIGPWSENAVRSFAA